MTPYFEIGLNFADAEKETGRKPIPDSDYSLQVSESSIGETGPSSKTPGSPMLKVVFDITESSEYNGRKLFYNVMLPTPDNKSSLFRIVELYKSLGLTWTGTGINTDDLLGRTCKARVGIKEYKGELSNEIKKLF